MYLQSHLQPQQWKGNLYAAIQILYCICIDCISFHVHELLADVKHISLRNLENHAIIQRNKTAKQLEVAFLLAQAFFKFFYGFALIEGKKVYWSPHVKMRIFHNFDAALVWLVEIKGEPRSTIAKEQMLRQSTAPGKHKALEVVQDFADELLKTKFHHKNCFYY